MGWNERFVFEVNNFYIKIIKPTLDWVVSLTILLLLIPLILFTTIMLLKITKGKPFFVQPRPGKDGKIFNLLKFRTMKDVYDSDGKLLPDKFRITRIGKWIRATSIDELPQLANVIMGDMSLVGPRPLLVKYLPLYDARQFKRHNVKPGITGWTQVNGRNSLNWNAKFEMDVWYVENISFLLDLKILFLTLVKVLKREGINAADAGTMVPFEGNLKH